MSAACMPWWLVALVAAAGALTGALIGAPLLVLGGVAAVRARLRRAKSHAA